MKKIIYIIILVLLATGIGFYFYREQAKKKTPAEQKTANLEQILLLNIKRTDLPAEKIAQYQKDFAEDKKLILNSEDAFNMSALMNIGQIKSGVGDFDGARDAWEYVSAKRPKNSLSFFNLGQLYAEKFKDNQQAEENFLKTLENSKDENGNEQYYRGVVDFYTYFYPEKITEVEKILLAALQTELYQNSQDLMALLATYYGNNGQKEKALEYWQKILKMDPGNTGVKGEIERLKLKTQ
jgi:tetratricopeptide (TPR) repeat protein